MNGQHHFGTIHEPDPGDTTRLAAAARVIGWRLKMHGAIDPRGQFHPGWKALHEAITGARAVLADV